MKTLLIDGNNLMFRAYYALPLLKSSSGKICNAIYGFCNMLISAIETQKPDYILVAFDKGKKTFRHKLYPGYKAQRSAPPEDLLLQFPMLKELLDVMGIKYFEDERFEADDIIGTLAKHNEGQVDILSGDKDLLQLVSDNVTLHMGKKGVSDGDAITPKNIVENFGVRADQVVDLKALMGDSSDNIPGVNGVGPKTATELITKYDTIENVYANIDNLLPKVRNKLIPGEESAKMSKILAKIDTDGELGFSITECGYTFPFKPEVRAMFSEFSFHSLMNRDKLFQGSKIANTHTTDQDVEVVNIEDVADLRDMFAQVRNTGAVAICFYEDKWHFSFSRYYEYIVSTHVSEQMEFVSSLKDCLLNPKIEKILYDVKEMMHLLGMGDIENVFDISLAMNIVSQPDRVFGLKDGLNYLQMNTDNVARDVFVCKMNLHKELKERSQLDLYYDIEIPLIKVLYDMEVQGCRVDRSALAELSVKYNEELVGIEQRIYAHAGKEFNINSPQQISDLLFNVLKLEYKGKKSTSIDVLEAIADQHPIVPEIMRYRKVQKLLSTYISGFLPYLDSKDKVHTTFVQAVTSTGRLASRSPNLQNIPVRDEEGKALRKLFVSSFAGGSITSADYNQIELRLMAHISQDPTMIADYNAGYDIHSSTASKVFGVPMSEVTTDQRRMAKTVNFGIIYGMSEYGLAKTLGIKPAEAKTFITKYFDTFPGVKQCMNDCVETAKQKGYTNTMFNRRRYIPEINSTNAMVRKFGERASINAPLQGSASDIIKLSMLKVDKAIKTQHLRSKLILQIHDELIVDTYPGEEELVAKVLKDNMDNVVQLRVPLIAEVNAGKSWFDCK